MLRVLLVLIAVLVAVLAFVFDRPWLYAAAAVPLLGALAVLARSFWMTSRSSPTSSAGTSAPDDSLEDLGIMDVRPQEREGGSNGTSASTGAAEQPSAEEAGPDPGAAPPEGESTTPQEQRLNERREERQEFPSEADSDSADAVQSHDHPVLGPLLESLRAALDAHTVCLLVQEEVVLDYQIAALVSLQDDAQREGSFETQSPLLSATMSRQPVTVRRLDEATRADLGYYSDVPAITQLAVAPLSRPDTSASVFLLADATADAVLDSPRARSLLERYAETVGHVLDVKEADAQPAHASSSANHRTEKETHEAVSPESAATSTGESVEAPEQEAPRPRREIIAEEMDAADVASDPLALVLVLLNRYESVARQGEAAVERAERHFRTRLEDLAPGQRVERFGELNYGIFVRRDVAAVEPWVLDLQEALARETGELEGGVSVGVAVRDAHHTPEELRADATEALLEAYETGECAIKA